MSNRLPIIQAEVAALHKQIKEHVRSAADKALIAGAALSEAKALVGHGNWAAWLAESRISERSAQRYMRLHRSGLKSATVADLGVAQAERIAGLMEKLWPEPGRGHALSGTGAGRTFWAVTFRPDDGGAFYSAMVFMVDGANGQHGHQVAMFKPLPAETLARLHCEELGAVPIETTTELDAAMAEKRLADFGCHLVRHSWGTRLETVGVWA